MADSNGWRTGSDPTLKALRIIVVLAILGLLVYIVVRDTDPDSTIVALFIGALFAALFGYSLALPFVVKRRDKDE